MGKLTADDLSILGRKEGKLVAGSLGPSDRVQFTILGNNGQAIVALADRCLVVKSGFLAGSVGGGRVTSFAYSDITGIQVNTGMLTATIEIHTPGLGATKAGDFWSRDKNNDPFKLPNCVPTGKAQLKEIQPYLDRLRTLVSAARQPHMTATITSPGSGVADQLAKLAELHAQGVINAEEFAQAKARALSA